MKIGMEHLGQVSKLERVKRSNPVYEIRASIESLNHIIDTVNTTDVGNEGLMDFLVGIVDSVIAVGKNLAVIITKGGDRSELKYWVDRNTVAVGRIEDTSMSAIRKVLVDYPTGMNKAYPTVVTAIEKVYNSADVLGIAKNCRTICDSLLVAMSRGSKDHEEIIQSELKKLSSVQTAVAKDSASLEAMFDVGKGLEKKELGQLIPSMTELKNIRSTLLGLEKKLLDVKEINVKLGEADESVKLAIDFINKSQTNGDLAPSKIFIRDFASYVRGVAEIAEAYALCATKHLAVEHNLVILYTTINDNK